MCAPHRILRRQQTSTRSFDNNGNLITDAMYIYNPFYTHAVIAGYADTNGDNSSDTWAYFSHDATYNVTAVVNTSGTVLQRQVYDAYGNVAFTAENFSGTPDSYNLHQLWQGGWRDDATGMTLFGARWYSPRLMRWISADLIGYSDGLNVYRAMANNPINRIDPEGTVTWSFDEKAKTVTATFLVNTNFKDYNGATWNLARENSFRDLLKSTIETAFNGTSFRIRPHATIQDQYGTTNDPYVASMSTQKRPLAPCAMEGFAPKIVIDLMPIGTKAKGLDWDIDVKANPTHGYLESTTWPHVGWSFFDEADVYPDPKIGAPAGVTQIPAVHEFGRFLGSEHPGCGISGVDEYLYAGNHTNKNEVNGNQDLMGVGMGMRPFYFQQWTAALNEKYGGYNNFQVDKT